MAYLKKIFLVVNFSWGYITLCFSGLGGYGLSGYGMGAGLGKLNKQGSLTF